MDSSSTSLLTQEEEEEEGEVMPLPKGIYSERCNLERRQKQLTALGA